MTMPCNEALAAFPQTAAVASEKPRELVLDGIELWVEQERVRCRLLHSGGELLLRSRTHNGLLLLLAEARIEDRAADLPASEQGWRYREDIASGLNIDQHLLNVWMYRARHQLQRADVVGAARFIERRASVRQLRLGPSSVAIRRR